ncbi:MAG: autotransporter-associated beta strand repeat-containing protein [Thermoguttaceae bacterium]|nr:autotransporter-associated beta strand repeat-containing protein [Thermoguttaceae bacterium]
MKAASLNHFTLSLIQTICIAILVAASAFADETIYNMSGSDPYDGNKGALTIIMTEDSTYSGKMSNISKITITGSGTWTYQDTVSNNSPMTNVNGIDVINGATFNFTGSADHFAHGLLNGKPFFIQNSTMTTSVSHGTNESPITLDHGTLTFKASGFINSYLHNVTMKNGSTINGSASGTYCRTNYQHDSTIRTQYVDGTPKDVLNTISVGVQSYGNKTLTLDVAEFAPLTISGAITQDGGTATVKKTGAGLLTLSSSASSFTGGFTISGGEVKVTGGWNSSAKTSPLGKLQNRTITVNNGALLTLNAQDILTNAHNDTGIKVVLDNGKIANEGPYYNAILDLTVKNGAQIYATDGNSTWKAFKLHNVSVVRSGDAVAAAPVVFAADMNQPNATYAFGAKSSDVATAASVINVADITSPSVSELDNLSDLIISGVVADAITVNTGVKTAGPITKTGAGILEFTAANTYSGPTTIQEGVIRLSGNGTLGTSAVTLAEGATLEFAYNSDKSFTNAVSGTGTILKTGSGDVAFTSANSYSANALIKDGSITLSKTGASGSFAAGTTITVDGDNAVLKGHGTVLGYGAGSVGRLNLYNGGTLENDSTDGHITIGSVVYMDSGLIHTIDASAAGDQYGNFILDNAVHVVGGTDNAIDAQMVTIRNDGHTENGGVFDVAQGAKLSVNSVIIDIPNEGQRTPLVKNGEGELVLSGASTYTKGTIVNAGTLKLTDNGTLGTGSVEIAQNGTLNYFVDEDATRTVEITNVNKIFGTGSVTKTGNGVLKINNEDYADSFSTGAFTVEAGELHFKGSLNGDLIVSDGALYSPGNSVGETSVTGDVLIDGGTILFEFEVFPGADADANHDFLTVSDDKTFTAGDNMVALYFDGDPQNWATVGGEYRLVANGSFASDDYSSWLSNYTDLFGLSGKADGLYLVSLAAPGPQPEPGSGVPEPSTWALLALSAAGLLYWRKRK